MSTVDLFYLFLFVCFLSGCQIKGKYHQKTGFNCPVQGSNAIDIDNEDGSLRSLSILSPCYPDDYYKNCAFEEACYVRISNRHPALWIGFYWRYRKLSASNDRLEILTYRGTAPNVECQKQLSNLSPGQLFCSIPPSHQTISVLFARESGHGETEDPAVYSFEVDMKMAYVMGEEEEIEAGSGGYIVSHRDFDGSSNNYQDSRTFTMTMGGLSDTDTVRFTFLSFNLSTILYFWCDDYFQIYGIQSDSGRDKTWFCGDKEDDDIIDLLPIFNYITFEFVTRTRAGTSSGFLLQYEVMSNACPPKLANAQEAEETTPDGLYRIECQQGYWIEMNTTVQVVDCSGNWRSSIKACVEIPDTNACPPYIPNSKAPEVVEDKKYKIECLSNFWTIDESFSLTIDCDNDNWKHADLRCIPRPEAITTTPVIPAKTATSTAEPLQTSQQLSTTEQTTSSDTASQGSFSSITSDQKLWIYISSGVGCCLFILILALVVFCVRKRNNTRETDKKEQVIIDVAGLATEGEEDKKAKNEEIYCLADTEPTKAGSSLGNCTTGIYELADTEPVHTASSVGTGAAGIYELADTEPVQTGSALETCTTGIYELADTEPVHTASSLGTGAAGIYELADTEPVQTGSALGTCTAGIYQLADTDGTYENAQASERYESDEGRSYHYSSAMAARKKQKSVNGTAIAMIENDLYGS